MLIKNNSIYKKYSVPKSPPQFQLFFPLLCLLICSFITFANQVTITPPVAKSATNISAVTKHGQLSIKDGQLVNQQKQAVSLAGPSLYWSNNGWAGESFYQKEVIKKISQQWQASIVRAAMGADFKGSYLTHPEDNLKRVETVIQAAIENGLYIIVDWHSHHAENNSKQAIKFFQYIAKKYGHLPNILYEIYNEPLQNTDWHSVIKPYSLKVISAIRAIDKNNLILVGSQSWSQDVDISAKDPITGFSNLAYTLHFYAGTHKEDLRAKAQVALDAGLALFVSEWGTVAADGNGDVDYQETEKWLVFMKKNQLSHCSWSLSKKEEGASIFKPSASTLGPWSDKDLTENGLYLKTIIQNWD
jgi:endoglucanase